MGNTQNIQITNSSNKKKEEQNQENKENIEEEEDYDIFAQNDKVMTIKRKTNNNSKNSENLNLCHNWDDSEGYYVVVPGDIIKDKYEVMGTSGKGVYSSVLRVQEIGGNTNTKSKN